MALLDELRLAQCKTMERRVVLTARDANGKLVKRLDMSAMDWYEGDCNLTDDGELIARLGIRRIQGIQTDRDGLPYLRWVNRYDEQGELVDSERWDLKPVQGLDY